MARVAEEPRGGHHVFFRLLRQLRLIAGAKLLENSRHQPRRVPLAGNPDHAGDHDHPSRRLLASPHGTFPGADDAGGFLAAADADRDRRDPFRAGRTGEGSGTRSPTIRTGAARLRLHAAGGWDIRSHACWPGLGGDRESIPGSRNIASPGVVMSAGLLRHVAVPASGRGLSTSGGPGSALPDHRPGVLPPLVGAAAHGYRSGV